MNTWKYGILKKNDVYYVCEVYPHLGSGDKPALTGPITPCGETIAELEVDLHNMFEDVIGSKTFHIDDSEEETND